MKLVISLMLSLLIIECRVKCNVCEILAIGDSITAGGGPPAGSIEEAATYRHRLEVLFQRNGVAADFVGDVCRDCVIGPSGDFSDHRCRMGCSRGPDKDKFIAFWFVRRNDLCSLILF